MDERSGQTIAIFTVVWPKGADNPQTATVIAASAAHTELIYFPSSPQLTLANIKSLRAQN